MLGDPGDARLPWRVTLCAALLGGAACLPLGQGDGTSLAHVLWHALREDWLSGLLFVVIMGAPHLFAWTVVAASRTGGHYFALWTRAWVVLLQTEVALIGLFVLRSIDEASMRAPWAIVGFAAVTVVFFSYRLASPSVPEHRRDLGFFARWGALLIAGTFGWFELQWLGGAQAPGPWLHATLAAAFALAASVPRER
jgi:hypothetical protein